MGKVSVTVVGAERASRYRATASERPREPAAPTPSWPWIANAFGLVIRTLTRRPERCAFSTTGAWVANTPLPRATKRPSTSRARGIPFCWMITLTVRMVDVAGAGVNASVPCERVEEPIAARDIRALFEEHEPLAVLRRGREAQLDVSA